MIMVHEGPNSPVFINADCIELFCESDGGYLRIKFNSGREVHAQETVEEFLAMLEKETKKNG